MTENEFNCFQTGRRTKIVCTIGPSTFGRERIAALVRAGMDVARLNFSHGDHKQHAQTIADLRAIAEESRKPIGILQDLAGPKLRVGGLPDGEVKLEAGDTVVLAVENASSEEIPLPVPEAPEALSAGDRVLLQDGVIELVVMKTTATRITAEVKVGGTLRSNQGVHLPDVELPIETVTEKDLTDLKFGLEQQVDWVAMSFVRRAQDLAPLKELIGDREPRPFLMSKIEQHEAIVNLQEIIDASDGVMVARGDLGIELPLEQVPALQKAIIQGCNRKGKPVVTATQMLESMLTSPRPTRAEVSDVANAVLDGTDAVMLSGETTIGRYPIEAVKMMAQTCVRAEEIFDYEAHFHETSNRSTVSITQGISEAVTRLASDLSAKAIITATSSGHTALMVALHRPCRLIVAVTPDVATQSKLTLVWGVLPLRAPRGESTDDLIINAIERSEKAGLVKVGDIVIVTAGVPRGPGKTNLIKVELVGEYHRF